MPRLAIWPQVHLGRSRALYRQRNALFRCYSRTKPSTKGWSFIED